MKKNNKLTKILVCALALTTLLGSISCFATEGLIIENKRTVIGDRYLESYLDRLEAVKRAEDRVVVEEEVIEETQPEETKPSDTKKEETPKKEDTKVETPKQEETKKEEDKKEETPKKEEEKKEEPKKEETKPYNVLNSSETYTITKSFGASEVERKYIEAANTVSIPSEYQNRVAELYNIIMNSSETEYKYEIETTDNRYWDFLEHYTRIYAGNGYRTLDDRLSTKVSHKDVEVGEGEDVKVVTIYIMTIDIASARNILNNCKAEAQAVIADREARQAELDKDYEEKLAQENKMRNYIKNAANSISLNGNKVHDLRAIHDWVCRNVSYDNSGKNYNIYHLVDTGKTQCSGYARVFQRICNYVGMNVKYVDGYGKTSAHAWNSVKIDGTTYYIDCTWDDTLGSTQYFLKTADVFDNDHSW